ncbi:hypothetical protein [Chryseobacterium sp. SIMBA_029]|uniref:hypothetical protein n=1 Tax=Chryseobacterium sp. SIMBA_029 TaxID=3085772 RepID=UPI0039783BE1
MKKFILVSMLIASSSTFSQVGVNTTNPKATFDVTGAPTDANKLDGIIAPRLTGDQLATKTYTTAQTGAIVYASAGASSLTGQVMNITSPSYYYFDGTVWQKFVIVTDLETLGIPKIAVVANVAASGNNTSFLGGDLGSNIRKYFFNNEIIDSYDAYNPSTGEFTAPKTGLYQIQINILLKAYQNNSIDLRLGLSKPYTGSLTSASNATFSSLTEDTFNTNGTSPVSILFNGLVSMTTGQKIIPLTRYITPGTSAGQYSLDVEAINYDRTFTNNMVITYFPN